MMDIPVYDAVENVRATVNYYGGHKVGPTWSDCCDRRRQRDNDHHTDRDGGHQQSHAPVVLWKRWRDVAKRCGRCLVGAECCPEREQHYDQNGSI